MILENVAQLRHVTQTIAGRGHPRTRYWDGEGLIPPEVVHKAAAESPLGDCTWIYYGMSYGPEAIRRYKLDIVDKEFRRVPGCRRVDPATLPAAEYFWARDRVAAGGESFPFSDNPPLSLSAYLHCDSPALQSPTYRSWPG